MNVINAKTEAPQYFQNYISRVKGDNIARILEESLDNITLILHGITYENGDYAYADGKWTIAQVMQHLIDCERVFCYRALAISRNEQQNLLSFDENVYANAAPASHRSLYDLAQELLVVRRSTAVFFESLTAEQFYKTGLLNGESISVEAIGYIIEGHFQHHLEVLKERYLVPIAE